MVVRANRIVTKSSGKSGGMWRKLQALTLASKGDVCGICGHPGSSDTDHIIPKHVRPDLAEEPSNLQPAHGVTGRCYKCDPENGRNCNGEKATMGSEEMIVCTEDWLG